MNTNFNWNDDVLNLMNALSFAIGLMNLELNQRQLSNESLDEHLKKQDNILDEQTNYYLKLIVEQNKEIINLLKGGTYGKD